MNYQGQYIVLDLEFEENEVIELAAQRIYVGDFGNQLVEGDSFNSLVKPSKNPSAQFLKLTKISLQALNEAREFSEVFKEFIEWVQLTGLETFYVEWGNRDEVILKKNCSKISSTFPYSSQYMKTEFKKMEFINLQDFIMLQDKLRKIPSLEKISKKEFGKFDGEKHHALDDAKNTAKILQNKLDGKQI